MWRNDELDYTYNGNGDRIVKIDVDSNLLPTISIDTYGTFTGDTEIQLELEQFAEIHELEVDDLAWHISDHDAVRRALSEAAVNSMNNQLCWGGGPEDPLSSDIVSFGPVQSTYSPRQYNFETDSFRTEATINVSRLIDWLRHEYPWHVELVDAVESYGLEHFSSRDGFISFVTGAMYDERRVGTLIWLGLHKYLRESLDSGQCDSDVREAERGAYIDSLEVTLDSNAWERMVNEGVARRAGVNPDHADLTVDEWKAWRTAAEGVFGSEDLSVAVPDLTDFRSELDRFVEAWVSSKPARLEHQWQTARMTGTKTCERCGLLPLDDDDANSPCEFWNEGK